MAELGETDEVAVLAVDLRMFERALQAAYVTQAAWDLIDQQRNMRDDVRESSGTRAVKKARDRVRGYLADDREGEADGERSDD